MNQYKKTGNSFVFLIISIILVLSLGCTTVSNRPIPATFYPQNNANVIVRMNKGEYTVYIDNEKCSIQVRLYNESFKDGVTDFFIGIRNNSDDSLIISRYTDFKLTFLKDGSWYTYNKASNIQEWINDGYRSQYYRDRMYSNFYQYYFKENDIRPNGDSSAGVLSFSYNNFDEFKLIIEIRSENLIFRRPGEYNIETYEIDFKK